MNNDDEYWSCCMNEAIKKSIEDEANEEFWISSDGERIIAYKYLDDLVDLDLGEPLLIAEPEFEFIFKDWIKVGDL